MKKFRQWIRSLFKKKQTNGYIYLVIPAEYSSEQEKQDAIQATIDLLSQSISITNQ